MASRVPPELLDKIFSGVELSPIYQHHEYDRQIFFDEDWVLHGDEWHQIFVFDLERFQRFPGFHTPLVPLLTVSRLWYHVAQRRLYRSITINAGMKRGCFESLLRTLTTNSTSRLAGLVRQMRFGSDNTIEASQIEALPSQIVSKCAGLERLTIISLKDLCGLGQTVSGLRSLKSLIVVGGEGNYRDESIYSIGELLLLLKSWPEIEYLTMIFFKGKEESETRASLNDVSDQDAELGPQLQFYCVNGTHDALQIRALATVAPALTTLDIDVDAGKAEDVLALIDSLHTWAPALEFLALRGPCQRGCGISIPESLCEQFELVQNLRVPACLVPPTCLVHFESLNTLNYSSVCVTDAELDALIEVIPSIEDLEFFSIDLPLCEPTHPKLAILKTLCTEVNIHASFYADGAPGYMGPFPSDSDSD